MRRGHLRALLAAALPAAALLASCAPRPVAPPELDLSTRRLRYLRLEASRVSHTAVGADLSLWLEADGYSRLPGATAELALGAPDACRLRVASAFGVAFDVAARGDSVVAYVPSRKVGLSLDAERDSLGLRAPGALAWRSFSAGWRPPDAAWSGAATADSLVVVRWAESRDSLALGAGPSGLPAWVEFRRPGSGVFRARYRSWERVEGVAWPSEVRLENDAGTVRATCVAHRVRFHRSARPEWFALQIPERATRLQWPDLRRELGRIKEP